MPFMERASQTIRLGFMEAMVILIWFGLKLYINMSKTLRRWLCTSDRTTSTPGLFLVVPVARLMSSEQYRSRVDYRRSGRGS
ncbi:hypothetical protein BST61_g6896 [Cercospora zeina]